MYSVVSLMVNKVLLMVNKVSIISPFVLLVIKVQQIFFVVNYEKKTFLTFYKYLSITLSQVRTQNVKKRVCFDIYNALHLKLVSASLG